MKIGNIELLNVDCMKYMEGLQDNAFDIAICDPQYGIGESKRTQSRPLTAKQKNGSRLYVSSARSHKVKEWDLKRPDPEYFQEIMRVSKHQIIWGGNHFADLLPPRSGWIIWDKMNQESDQSDCELAWTSFKCGARKVEFLWNGFIQGRPDDFTRAQGNKKLNEKRIHPTQKPVPVYKWLLKHYAEEGMTVLDTHGGSASLGIACLDYKFDATICEIDKDYFDAAVKRLQNHVAQTVLF